MSTSAAVSSSYESYLDRKKRTVELQVAPGKHLLDRTDFCPYINHSVGLASLLAFGPTSERGSYQLTFATEEAARQFLQAGSFFIHDRMVKVNMVAEARYRIRIHWVPYYIPDSAVIDTLEAIPGVRVHHIYHEKLNKPGLEKVGGNVRTAVVQATNTDNIPQFVQWEYGTDRGRALIVNPNKAPTCLRCKASGHVRKDCTTPYCTTCKRFGHTADKCIDFPAMFTPNFFAPETVFMSNINVPTATGTAEAGATALAYDQAPVVEGQTASAILTPEIENNAMKAATAAAAAAAPASGKAAVEVDKIPKVKDLPMQFSPVTTANKYEVLATAEEDVEIIPPSVIPQGKIDTLTDSEDDDSPDISEFPSPDTIAKTDLALSDESGAEQDKGQPSQQVPLEENSPTKYRASDTEFNYLLTMAPEKKNWAERVEGEEGVFHSPKTKQKPLMSDSQQTRYRH